MSKVQNMMTVLNSTVVNGSVNTNLFTENEVIKDKFISVYQKTQGVNEDEALMYFEKEKIHFSSTVTGNASLSKSPIDLYKAFITAAVLGLSFDPNEHDLYLIPRGGKVIVQLQAMAEVKLRIQSGIVTRHTQPQTVREGDVFEPNEQNFIHKPVFPRAGKLIALYMWVYFPDGSKELVWRGMDFFEELSNCSGANKRNYSKTGFLATKLILHYFKKLPKPNFKGATVEHAPIEKEDNFFDDIEDVETETVDYETGEVVDNESPI